MNIVLIKQHKWHKENEKKRREKEIGNKREDELASIDTLLKQYIYAW